MRAFRFNTRISKTGTIQVPLDNQLYDKEVEVIILPRQEEKSTVSNPVDFINKWSGFLSNQDVEDSRYRYLMEKYK